MTVHNAHINQNNFDAIRQQIKRYEVFEAGSAIQKGDTIILNEYVIDPKTQQATPTGQQQQMMVGFASAVGEKWLVASLLPMPEINKAQENADGSVGVKTRSRRGAGTGKKKSRTNGDAARK